MLRTMVTVPPHMRFAKEKKLKICKKAFLSLTYSIIEAEQKIYKRE